MGAAAVLVWVRLNGPCSMAMHGFDLSWQLVNGCVCVCSSVPLKVTLRLLRSFVYACSNKRARDSM